MVNNHGSRKNKSIIIPDFGKVTYEHFSKRTVYVRDTMGKIAGNFIYIGHELKFIKDNKLFKLGDYKSFIDYCKVEFGLNKNQAYNFINIYEKFGHIDYTKYSYSTLVEMLSLTDEQVKKVPPGATVKEVREIKKKEKENIPDVGKNEEEVPMILDGQISCDDIVEDEVEEVEIENIFKDSRNKLSSKSKFLFAFSLWIGINKLLEEKKEPYGAVKELVDYYSKVYIMDAKVLRDKLKEYPLSCE